MGVKDRSISQLRVILVTLSSPPLNGGIFWDVTVPYTAVYVDLPAAFQYLVNQGDIYIYIFRDARASVISAEGHSITKRY